MAVSARFASSALVPSRVRRTQLYRDAHGRWPPFRRPATFTEKLNWRILFDRRPLLHVTCDKLAMKDHARARTPGVCVPETYWFGTDVGELTGVRLPAHWVLKPNHSCRRVHLGSGAADVADLARTTAGWGQERYWRVAEEWAYRKARPGLLVEELIGGPSTVLADYKVFVLDGTPRLIGVHTDRGPRHRSRYYTTDWQPLPWTDGRELAPVVGAPTRLPEMVAAARALADGFDMLRVDFYEHGGALWFGELTPYPGAGVCVLDPELDRLLGDWWTLPPLRRALGVGRRTAGRE